MIIENTDILPVVQVGRPNLFPFEKLLPGQKLTITPDEDNIKELRKKVTSSLYHYKRNNGLAWTTAIRTEKGLIVVYRIN